MASHIVSGADEKVIWIFDPPFGFVKDLNSLSKSNFVYSNELSNE